MDINKTLSKKEYQQLALPKWTKSKYDWNENFLQNYVGLMLHTGQLFAEKWLSVHIDHTRILLKHETGTGKSIAQVATAMAHIKYYQDNYDVDSTVYIIGFSEQIIKNELLSRKEFGFITESELHHLKKLEYIKSIGTDQDRQAYRDFKSTINRRLKKKYLGGYFQFIGYKKFYNKVFLTDLLNINEEELYEGINAGTVEVNWRLIKTFANMLIICDEIHNVYNSVEINNYGIALKFVLNLYTVPMHMSTIIPIPKVLIPLFKTHVVKIMMTSATPINNKSTEIVDLINILVPATKIYKYTGEYELNKNHLFVDGKLKRGAKTLIADLVFGYVSYLSGKDPTVYPARKIMGERLAGIKYLKFIKCKMSAQHKKVFNAIYNTKDNTIPPDSYIVDDIFIPDPDGGDGIHQQSNMRKSIINAPDKWLKQHKINFISSPFVLSGAFLSADTIAKYSGKYKTVLDIVLKNLENDGGKVYINHQRVKGSGVLLIEQILLENGFINEYSQPVNSTRCSICGVENIKHKDDGDHDYMPARFIIVHGGLPTKIINDSLRKYNDKNNIHGHQISVLIGSKKTNEGMDFNAIRHVLVVQVPKDISTLIQIMGRAVRNKSHVLLPDDQRNVSVYLLVANVHEIKKYKEKMLEYLQIQEIETVLNSESIDSRIHRSIIEPTMEVGLGALPFTPTKKLDKHITITNDTFHFFANDEIKIISYIIKRLFLEQSDIWDLSDLWDAVCNPPFQLNVNRNLFDKDHFYIAVNNMIWKPKVYPAAFEKINLMDMNQVLLYINGEMMAIIKTGNYLMLVTIDNKHVPIDKIDEQRKVTKLGTSLFDINGTPNIYLGRQYIKRTKFNITKNLSGLNMSYAKMKLKFFEQYRNIPIEFLPTSLEVYDITFHQHMIEDAIKYAFNIMINPNMSFSELHKFYFKLIYFYDRMELIVYANHLIDYPEILERYSSYIKPDPKSHADYNHLLQSSIIRSDGTTNDFTISRLNKYLRSTKSKKVNDKSDWCTKLKVKTKEKFMHLNIMDAKDIIKTPIMMLPVGHFVNTEIVPHMIDPVMNTFAISNDIIIITDSAVEVESDIIIGYYEKSNTRLQLSFKLKLPKHKTKSHQDHRLVERGMACSSKSKKSLIVIAKQLGITNMTTNTSIKKICLTIKHDLLVRELAERRLLKHNPKHKKIRWFYMQFETHI